MTQSLYNQHLKLVTDTLWRISDQSEFWNFLEDMMTPQEIVEMGERIKLIQLLLQGKTQREVAAELWISVTTVNRGARMINYGTGVLKKILSYSQTKI